MKGRHVLHDLQRQLKSLSYNLSTSVVTNGGQKYIEFAEPETFAIQYTEVVDVVLGDIPVYCRSFAHPL